MNNLDEWIEFLKTGEISEAAQAPGLADARKCLDIDKLTVAEKNDYVRHMENLRYQRSVIKTGYDDGWQKGLADGREEGRAEGRAEGREEGQKKDEKKDVPKEPKMRRRPQPVVFLQWACLPSKWQQQPSCH